MTPEKTTAEQLWQEKYFPLWVAGREEEERRRSEDFLTLSTPVAGQMLRQMTPYHLLLLDGIASPFAALPTRAAFATADDVVNFLWILHEKNRHFTLGGGFHHWIVRSHVAYLVKQPNGLDVARAAIAAFVSRTFADKPTGGGEPSKPIGAHFLAPLIVRVACETGWSEAEIFHKPLARLFQYLRALERRERGAKAIDYSQSDKITADWQDEINARRAAGTLEEDWITRGDSHPGRN